MGRGVDSGVETHSILGVKWGLEILLRGLCLPDQTFVGPLYSPYPLPALGAFRGSFPGALGFVVGPAAPVSYSFRVPVSKVIRLPGVPNLRRDLWTRTRSLTQTVGLLHGRSLATTV